MAESMEIDEEMDDAESNDQLTDENLNSVDSRHLNLKQQKRLDYLLEQADLFSHFIDNSQEQAAKRKKVHQSDEKSHKRHTHDKSVDENMDEHNGLGVRFDQTPSYIQGTMRDYQLRGLNWMISLYERGINGILADEMGLGKTLQSISVLGFMKHYEKINGPFLVIGPKSTLQNWLNETNRFCPTLRALTLIGDKAARTDVIQKLNVRKSWDVLLTTFEMCLAEKSALKRIQWRYLVVDEAHRLKNENNKLSSVLRTFYSSNRLLLTGTPLQNNLHELWALLNFLLPDVFASSHDFDTWFDSDDCLKGNNDIVKRLRTILQPFMLRRIKADVEKSLLPKIELKLFVGLTTLQRETYKKVLVKEIMKTNEFGEQVAKPINMILQELRKAAYHPYLIDGIEPGPPYTTDEHLVNCCGKMMVMDKLLAKLKAKGSRVVMFSQFTMMLDILEDYLNLRGYKYRRLDGQTPYEDRATGIDEFNAENSDIFVYIISTRAGGLGINLATADTVIIYDSDWNPQPDIQAIDRVHRIGQTKQVRVFRLVAENTVDERIVQRAEIKQRLDKMIIQQGKAMDKNLTEMTKGMKRDMIRFGMDRIMGSDGMDVIDVDIEKILKEGELKMAEENETYAKLGEGELRNLTLEEASSVSLYQFEGVDFRKKGNKSNDDGAYMFRERKSVQYVTPIRVQNPSEPPRRMKYLADFKFYPRALLALSDDDGWINLAEINDNEYIRSLLLQGFQNWKRSDFKVFCNAMAKFGRNDIENIASMLPEKTLAEVTEYHRVFWKRGKTELERFDRIVERIQKKEHKENQMKLYDRFVSEAFHWKMSSQQYHAFDFTFRKRKDTTVFTDEQDNFLMVSLYKYGLNYPNVYFRIRRDISMSKKHKFDFFLRSRTAAELERRAKYLLRMIISEYEGKIVRTSSIGSSSGTNTLADNGKNIRKKQLKPSNIAVA